MGERFQQIKAGIEKALNLQKFHKESLENRPAAKPAVVQEKPVNVVKLTNKQAKEAGEYAENNYEEKAEEEYRKAV